MTDVVPVFTGTNYKAYAENAINSVSVSLAGILNKALAPVNKLLVGPADAVRVGVWGTPQAITIAFGPRELTPPSGGTVFGALRWDTSKPATPASCDGFVINAVVQTGPAPIRQPSGTYLPGEAPKRKVGSFQLQSTAAGDCRYRMTGLAAGWPNQFTTPAMTGKTIGINGVGHSMIYAITGEGRDGHNVVPQPSAERNFAIKFGMDRATALIPAGTIPQVQQAQFEKPVNPLLGGGIATRPVLAVVQAVAPTAVQPATGITQNRGGLVALNPQPLPPAGLPASGQQSVSPVFSSTSAFTGRGR